MSNTDFDNGFACGVVLHIVRSGDMYQPVCRNDSGIYSYFYIDFRRAMMPFSLGMFNESILVYDSVQIRVTRISLVSTGVYKIYCDISDRIHGITVLNKKTTRLRFASGEQLPVFSVHFYVLGQDAYTDLAYLYENIIYQDAFSTVQESFATELSAGSFELCSVQESAIKTFPAVFANETCSIILT